MQNVETSLPDIWTKLGSEISWEMPVFKILLNFDFLVFILIERDLTTFNTNAN